MVRVKTYDFRAFCQGQLVRTNWHPWWLKCLEYVESHPLPYARMGMVFPPYAAEYVYSAVYQQWLEHMEEEGGLGETTSEARR